jgi:hypothetical protein
VRSRATTGLVQLVQGLAKRRSLTLKVIFFALKIC